MGVYLRRADLSRARLIGTILTGADLVDIDLTAAELGKRTSIERFFGRVLVFFRLQRPPVCG